MTIQPMPHWQSPATVYPRRKIGDAAIRSIRYGPGVYHAYNTHPPGGKPVKFFEVRTPITVTSLVIGRKTWMVDDPPHWWAMQDHASYYHGRVLVAGLGLGLFIHALTKNPKVTSVHVVERNRNVMKLVEPCLPALPFTYYPINEDWNEYEPQFEPDGVFYDLFVGDGRALLPEALHVAAQLASEYLTAKVIRIHGFPNGLQDLCDGIRRSNEKGKRWSMDLSKVQRNEAQK